MTAWAMETTVRTALGQLAELVAADPTGGPVRDEVLAALRPVLVLLDGAAEPAADAPGLTPRELEVLGLLADGLTAHHIGHLLGIRTATVRKHLEHLYDKLGCRDRLLAVSRARAAGLL